MSKKIVCWVGDAPNHRALVNKIAAAHNVVGIVVDSKKQMIKSPGLKGWWKKLVNKIRFGRIDNAWSWMQHQYRERFPGWPNVKILKVNSINDPKAFDFTRELQPDLVIISGTSLVKEPMVSLPLPIGIMNLHTGLSPYVKGGPNCTNWCIANDQWGLVGNTIMWLSAGIDSGNIITSERTTLGDQDDLPAIHFKVMEHAHELYLRAIQYIINARPPFQSIAQGSFGKGNLYLTKMWTGEKKKKLLQNLGSAKNTNCAENIQTVPLPR